MKRSKANAGYTIVELLVAMLLSGVSVSVLATDFSHTVHHRHDMMQVAETQQAVKATMTFVSQELRQAGACLPALGQFLALDGEDSGTRDSLTLRIGKIRGDTMTCVRTVTLAAAEQGESILTVQDVTGFEAGQYIYVTRIGGAGSTFTVASVDDVTQTVTVDGVLDADYLVGSGVYAVEQRTYAIDDEGEVPVLTVSIDDETAEPLAKGIDVFDISYRLGNCIDCNSVDLPEGNAEWRLVREIELTVSATTPAPLKTGQPYTVTETTTIKPRNLL